jgi:hypothetical protein
MDGFELNVEHPHCMVLKQPLQGRQRVDHDVLVIEVIELVLLDDVLQIHALRHEHRFLVHDLTKTVHEIVKIGNVVEDGGRRQYERQEIQVRERSRSS